MCFHKWGKWHIIEEGEIKNNMDKVKRYWHYEIESVYGFNYAFNIGLYKLNKKELE